MLIRCNHCQAQFSLQDGAAAPGAKFKVRCGRCLSQFDAAAPLRLPSPGRDITPTPTPQHPIPAVMRAPSPGAVERNAPPDAIAQMLQPKAEARRSRALWLVVPVVLLATGALAIAQVARQARKTQERLEKARELMLRDDQKSLEQATALFTEAARLAPGDSGPEGERAFALLVQAAAQQDLAGRGTGEEREAFTRAATRRLQEGFAAAKAALEDDRDDPAALKAMALHAALAGNPDMGALPLERAAKASPQDPWIAWTRAQLALSGPAAREKQDRALAALSVARQAEPRMLRAQVDLAAISLDRQETGPARDVLSKVLAANPAHERAKRLLSLLPAAP